MNISLNSFLMAIDWPGILVPALSLGEKVLRTVAVYVFLVLALRLAGKRELAQLNPFDFIVLLVLSNTLQNAVIGPDNSVTGGFVGAAVLLALNWAVNRWLIGHQRLEQAISGGRRVLIANGRIDAQALKKELITHQELVMAAHKQGIADLEEVESAEIDPDGELFFVTRTPPPEVLRHHELLEQMHRLSKEIEQLKRRLPEKG
jgi:uncharacterized membrane protein YcaP (DUF421 family)